MIKVLLVDDSATSQLNLRQLLGQDSEISVVASVSDGEAALDAARRGGIDVIVMDVWMPKMNGFDATRHIMAHHPLPIVVCSSSAGDPQVVISALESGACAVVEKPPGPTHPGRQLAAVRLLHSIKQAAKISVSRRSLSVSSAPTLKRDAVSEAKSDQATPLAAAPIRTTISKGTNPARSENFSAQNVEIVAIGASTGGPPGLQTLFETLKPDFPAPILVVQHIAVGFLPGMVNWLRASANLPIHIAAHGEVPLAGHVYFAPDDHHLGVDSTHRLCLADAPSETGLRPSVAWLFRSVAQVYGAHSMGFLLSGMGRDGARELDLMRAAGAETWAQSQESCLVFGMPGEAIRLGAAAHIDSPQGMAKRLNQLKAARNGS